MREGDEPRGGGGQSLRVSRTTAFRGELQLSLTPRVPVHVCMALVMSLFCIGCHATLERHKYDIYPMPGIWAGTVAGIEDLQLRRATIPEWEASAADSKVVGSIGELKEVLARVPLAEREMSGLVAEFAAAVKVLHFGFEGNFHALVYFDQSGRAYRTVKW